MQKVSSLLGLYYNVYSFVENNGCQNTAIYVVHSLKGQSRGVQYVLSMTHKCVMVKIGERKTHKFSKNHKLDENRGEIYKFC